MPIPELAPAAWHAVLALARRVPGSLGALNSTLLPGMPFARGVPRLLDMTCVLLSAVARAARTARTAM